MKPKLNKFRFEPIGDKVLITTDHGSNLFLTPGDFELLKKGLYSGELFSRLYKAGVLIDDNNFQDVVSKYKLRQTSLFQGTSLHIIVLTHRCNMKCVYCHASAEDESCAENDMTKETAKEVVDFLMQSPSNEIMIEFQGGEPTLNFETLKYIYNYSINKNKILKKDLLFSVVTNFAAMTEEKLDWLVSRDIGICTSLDGPKELHDFNRKIVSGDESYEKVSYWIKQLEKKYVESGSKDKFPNALITTTKKSLNLYKEIVDEYISLGLKNLHLRFLNELGFAKNSWGVIGYSPDDFIEFWKNSLDYIVKRNAEGDYIRERQAEIILRKICTDFDPNYLEMKSPCGAAIGQMAYNPNGDVYTCDEARMIDSDLFKLGNVSDSSYKSIIVSNKCANIVSSSVNDSLICDYCAYKAYCGICPVCNYAEQGSIKPDILKTSRCKIYMAQFTYLFEKLQDPYYRKVFHEWLDKDGHRINELI